jgi:hypothetical protein
MARESDGGGDAAGAAQARLEEEPPPQAVQVAEPVVMVAEAPPASVPDEPAAPAVSEGPDIDPTER